MKVQKQPLFAFLALTFWICCACQPSNSFVTKDECEQQMEQINRKDFLDWHGLSPKCDAATVAAYGKGDLSKHGSYYKGKKYIPIDFTPLHFSGYEEPARLWFRNERLALLEFEFPDLPNPNELISNLGEPGAKLNYYYDIMYLENSEFVYPDRGLTLFISPENADVYKIWVYSPLSIEAYIDSLHHEEAPREFPLDDERE